MHTIPHLKIWPLLLINRSLYRNSNIYKNAPLQLKDLINRIVPRKLQEDTAEKLFNNRTLLHLRNANPQYPLNQNNNLMPENPSMALMEKFLMPNEQKSQDSPLEFDFSDISQAQTTQNSEQFMKYLAHSLDKGHGETIIETVELYCRQKKHLEFQQSKEKGSSRAIEDRQKKAQQRMFSEIKKILLKGINIIEQRVQINCEYIDCLLICLSRSNPQMITLQDFYTHANYAEIEESQHNNIEKKFRMLEHINGSYNTNKYSTEPTQEKVEVDKYKKSLELALKKDKEKSVWEKPKRVMTYQKSQKHRYISEVRLAEENMVFKKIENPLPYSYSMMDENNKYAYVYELPYNITDEEASHFLKFLQSSKKVRIESFILFSYKEYLQKSHQKISYKVPDNFSTQKLHLQKIHSEVKIETTNPSQRKNPARQTKKNYSEEKKSVTDALLSKIQRDDYSKFNKSSMVIKFENVEDKQKVLKPQARLFGMNYKNLKSIKLEEGYCKTMVSLHGIPKQCTSLDLQQQLNKILTPLKLAVRCDEEALTKSVAFLQFDYLTEALLAIEHLNNKVIHNKKLKANLTYGPCKIFKSEYEMQIQNSYELLKKKIQQSCHEYSLRYQYEDTRDL